MTEADRDRRFVISDNVVHRELDGEAIVLNLDSGVYYGLNPTGTHAWRLLERGATLGEVVTALTRTFSHPAEQVEADFRILLGELEAKGLVTIARP